MRDNVVWLFAGTRGTGKTSLIKKAVKSSLMKKILIVDTFDSSAWRTMEHHGYPEGINEPIPIIKTESLSLWNKGLYRLASSDTDYTMSIIQSKLQNALLIFEDATKYIEGKLTGDIKNFVIDSKQKNLDLIFVFHSLADIPPKLVRNANFLTMLKTQESVPSKLNFIPNIKEVKKKIMKSKNRYEYETITLS